MKLLTATRKVMKYSIRKSQIKLFEKHSTSTSLNFFQFEVVEREYKCKRTGEVKLTKRTERIQKLTPFHFNEKGVFSSLLSD